MKHTIYTYTVIHSTSEDFKDKTPYVAAIIDDGQKKEAVMIEGYRDGMEIKIGDEVSFSHNDEIGNPIFKFS